MFITTTSRLIEGMPVVLKTHFPNVEHLILENYFSVSPTSKVLLVQEAVKAWPRTLKSISLSFEDESEDEWKYVHLVETLDCEEIIASAAASGNSPPTADQIMAHEWKVKKIAY